MPNDSSLSTYVRSYGNGRKSFFKFSKSWGDIFRMSFEEGLKKKAVKFVADWKYLYGTVPYEKYINDMLEKN